MTHHADDQLVTNEMLMLSGSQLDLNDDGPEGITLIDIAQGLAHQCRYAGQVNHPYSVAQHSVLLAFYTPKHMRRYALMHDAAEFLLGDKIRPVKTMLPDYKALERRFAERIYRKYGVVPEAGLADYDFRITVDELIALRPMAGVDYELKFGVKKLNIDSTLMKPWHWASARGAWLRMFSLLFPEHRAEFEKARDYFAMAGDPQPQRYIPFPEDLING